MSNTIRHPAPTGGTWYAYPIENGDFADWMDDRIPLTDPDDVGLYSGEATTPGPYGIFEGADAPTNWGTDMVATWVASSPTPAGQHAVTVTVDDTNSELVEGARVRLTDTSGTPTGVRGTSGTLGVAELSADDGDYEVRVSPPTGYQTPDPVPITVDGGPVPVTVTLTAVSIPPAPEPQLCTVRVRVRDQFGVPIVGATVTALIAQTRIAADAMLINSGDGETTDADGNVDLTLFRNTEFAEVGTGYTIRAVVGNRSAFIDFVVPDAPTANATLVV